MQYLKVFFLSYPLSATLICLGAFFVIMTYGAWFASIKSGHFVSGVPVVGGLLIMIGFLTSPYKILCLMGLLDYGFWELLFIFYYDFIYLKTIDKRYSDIFRKYGDRKVCDNDTLLAIKLGDRMFYHVYETAHVISIHRLKTVIAICLDCEGNRYLMIDRRMKKQKPQIISFDSDLIQADDINYDRKNVSMTMEIVKREQLDVIKNV